MNGFDYMLVNIVEIVPVANLRRHAYSSNERNCDRQNHVKLLHRELSPNLDLFRAKTRN
jgi:hypothetical protein